MNLRDTVRLCSPGVGRGRPTYAFFPEPAWLFGLPSYERPIVGRETELRVLDTLRTRPGCVVIEGEPGVGKTALILRWANTVAHEFRDGCIAIDFNGTSSRDQEEQILTSLLQRFGVPVPRNRQRLVKRVRRILRKLRALIVLENVASIRQLEPFLAGSANAVVAVGRNGLMHTGEEDLVRIRLERLGLDDSRRLLAWYVGERWMSANPEIVDAVLRDCGGLPRRLRDAARRLRHESDTVYRETVAELHANLPKEAEWVLLRVCAQPLPTLSLSALATLAETDVETTEHLARILERNLLLRFVPEDRIEVPEVVREYVTGRADDAEREVARSKVTRWYVQNVARAGETIAFDWAGTALKTDDDPTIPCPFPGDRVAAMRWCALELPFVVDLVANLVEVEEHLDEAWRLAVLCTPYLFLNKHRDSFLKLARLAVRAARSCGDRVALGRSLHVLAWILHEQGKDKQAEKYLSCALGLLKGGGDDRGCAWVRYSLGVVRTELRNYKQALLDFRTALDHFRAESSSFGVAVVKASMALTLNAVGDAEQANTVAKEAVSEAESLGNPSLSGLTLLQRASLYERQGRPRAMTDCAGRGLDERDHAGELWGVADALFVRAKGLLAQGRPEDAILDLERALAIFERLRDPRSLDVQALLVELDLSAN